jgi:type I restriction-modification system DNA methylase subunit
VNEGGSTNIHEQEFCGEIAKWAEGIFKSLGNSPFREVRVEARGKSSGSTRRKDLTFYGLDGRPEVTGEVKLPGTPAGRSAFDDELVAEAQAKADEAGARYFFTWNVNSFLLWDRYRQDKPRLDRCVREWTCGRYFRSAGELGRAENLAYIRDVFLPTVLAEVGDICAGRRSDWQMAPDELFLRSFESHLNWPVEQLRAYLAQQADESRSFDNHLQEWLKAQNWAFVRRQPEAWGETLDRAARTIVYVFANRLIFYQSLRARFPDLPALTLSARARNAEAAYDALQRQFETAVRRSGDYEPLFYPHEKQDWAGPLVFAHPGALDAWRGALRNIASYDFSHISSDVVGRIFQKLISPEERHRWGQHFTGDDIVDLINSFCIRESDAVVLDPACGSGSFLVRAYYRKRRLNHRKPHLELISELFGCDIALYPAHLATLNLAAREINDEANYPRVARRDFFDIDEANPFCSVPDGDGRSEIVLPRLDAVVGNPPYVRQEKLGDSKLKMAEVVTKRAPSTKLSGRSDVHCYFWPAAAYFLREGGYFGFLTSSSWLDVEYGFALQRWILENFQIIAICESEAEPWFEDARVKTCATIMRKCANRDTRMNSLVRFVQFKRPLAEIVAEPADGTMRFKAVDRLRDQIEAADADLENERFRIIVKRQGELWNEGVRAGRLIAGVQSPAADDDDDIGDEAAADESFGLGGQTTYAAGKWGRYLRAPDFYFEVMREFGTRFVPLGEITEIRRGITSGCDAFFMPHDITGWALETCLHNAEFKRRFGGVERAPVESGKVKLIRAGDGSVHPIEAEYLRPEVHSLMTIDRPQVRASDLDRVVLLVSKPLSELRGTWVSKYIRYGETHPFDSRKSKPVPVPKRSTVASRSVWYDLSNLVKPGFALWPMSQQYRHIIAHNPEALICNHNLFDISSEMLTHEEQAALIAILNSTPVGLFKTFYGRFAGTEGNLKTEVIDVDLLEVPDPRGAPVAIRERIRDAFERLCTRPIGRLVEEQLMDCHSPEHARIIASGPLVLPEELRQPDRRELDDAVFELLGVQDPKRRRELVDRLYVETALHFRKIRVVEIQKQLQRSKTGARRYTTDDLANDVWSSANLNDWHSLLEWLSGLPGPKENLAIPDGSPAYLMPSSDMYDRDVVYFGTGRNAVKIKCRSREQAELIARLVNLGLHGPLALPVGARECREHLARLDTRLEQARAEFEQLAESRGGSEKTRAEVVELLMHWLIHGRDERRPQ